MSGNGAMEWCDVVQGEYSRGTRPVQGVFDILARRLYPVFPKSFQEIGVAPAGRGQKSENRLTLMPKKLQTRPIEGRQKSRLNICCDKVLDLSQPLPHRPGLGQTGGGVVGEYPSRLGGMRRWQVVGRADQLRARLGAQNNRVCLGRHTAR